jgi:HEAT repeat protein
MTTPDIQALLDDCRSGDSTRQVNALIELNKLHVASAVSEIVPLLSSPDADVREESARALGYLGKPERARIGPALLPLLDDTSASVRAEAAEALGLLGYPPEAVESLKRLLHQDPDWLVRASAAEALGNFGDVSTLGDLTQALEDEESTVQAYAALSLGLIAPPSFQSTLETALASKADDPAVKTELSIALYRLGAPDALQRLLDLTKTISDEEAPRLLNGIEDLTNLKTPASLRADAPALRAALAALAQRLPTWRAHVAQILEELRKLEQAL